MSKKIKPSKPLPVQRWNDAKQGTAAPKFADVPISGGTDAGEAGKNFDRAIARRSKALVECTQISGAGQKGELARKLGPSSGNQLQSKFRKADGRIGSISNYSGFAKAAKQKGND